MKKLLLITCTLLLVFAALSAEKVSDELAEETQVQAAEENQKPFQNHLLTMAGFKALQTDEKDFVLSPSLNLQYMRFKNKGVESKQPDAIIIAGGYSLDHYTKGLGPDEVDNFHNINLMGNVAVGKNTFTGILAANGQVPFSSITTLTAGLMYSRQIVKTDNISFTAGAGIIVADLGLNINDVDIYCIPLPVFSFNYNNDYLSTGISMMGMPSLSLSLFPKSIVRFNGSCGLAGFSSVRDITFDCALVYYPLFYTNAKEFLSVSAGVMNTVNSSFLKDKTKYSFQYYSVYGEINASLVKLRAGYNFDGEKRINKDVKGEMYKGLFASVQAMFMF